MAKLPFDLGSRSFSSQSEKDFAAATAPALALVKSASNAASSPAACCAQAASVFSRYPTDPRDMRIARSVNSFGGFFRLARAAA